MTAYLTFPRPRATSPPNSPVERSFVLSSILFLRRHFAIRSRDETATEGRCPHCRNWFQLENIRPRGMFGREYLEGMLVEHTARNGRRCKGSGTQPPFLLEGLLNRLLEGDARNP